MPRARQTLCTFLFVLLPALCFSLENVPYSLGLEPKSTFDWLVAQRVNRIWRERQLDLIIYRYGRTRTPDPIRSLRWAPPGASSIRAHADITPLRRLRLLAEIPRQWRHSMNNQFGRYSIIIWVNGGCSIGYIYHSHHRASISVSHSPLCVLPLWRSLVIWHQRHRGTNAGTDFPISLAIGNTTILRIPHLLFSSALSWDNDSTVTPFDL
ncbi:hypothetical protein H4582DRAFT_2051389 [Lactarius indigo]|nr:hypothetical protein H4582DRAFT_2051389 [Lactarius indigo]